MTKMRLELGTIELQDLCAALEDHAHDGGWCLDRLTGKVAYYSADDQAELERRDPAWITPIPSQESYRDMGDFIQFVTDLRARELLGRAIAGRGAFRRFKDTLFEFPELRQAWFDFHDARMTRRAIAWLRDEGCVAEDAANAAIAAFAEPPIPVGGVNADAIAHSVASDLRELYGSRLRGVVLFGSRARGDADDESDLYLLVLLDRVDDPWAEDQAMDDVLWQHTLDSAVTVIALPVSELDFVNRASPLLENAAREGRRIA